MRKRIVLIAILGAIPVTAMAFSFSIPGIGGDAKPKPPVVAPGASARPADSHPAGPHPAGSPPPIAGSLPSSMRPPLPKAPDFAPKEDVAVMRKRMADAAQVAQTEQSLQNRIAIAQLQAKYAALQKSIEKTRASGMNAASAPPQGAAVLLVEGQGVSRSAVLSVDGRQYDVTVGSHTPLGVVRHIGLNGVTVAGPEGLLRIGMGTGVPADTGETVAFGSAVRKTTKPAAAPFVPAISPMLPPQPMPIQ